MVGLTGEMGLRGLVAEGVSLDQGARVKRKHVQHVLCMNEHSNAVPRWWYSSTGMRITKLQ